jgi:predicted Zn-dependent protease
VAAPFAGCTENKATGKKIFTLGMTRNEEIALGSEAAPGFTKEYGGKVPSEPLQQYVSNIGHKMAKETEDKNPSLPWEFTLLNTDVVNAFALPGGKVFFTRGLAEKLTDESQMAGVMGHEIGHVTAQHGAQRIASQTAFNVGMIATAVAVGVSGNNDVKNIGAVRHTRACHRRQCRAPQVRTR